jgi:hypothetical protein
VRGIKEKKMNSNNPPLKRSPQTYARVGGLLYLAIIVLGIFTEFFIRDKLIVSGDPASTANNIIASPLLWRIGIAGDLIMHVCDIVLMLIFYILLRPVNKNLALLAVLFNFMQSAVMVAFKLNLINALYLVGSADYLTVFDPRQLNTLMYLSIRLDGIGFGIGLIFFGFACLIMGYLIYASGYLPKVIGVLMQIAGTCYLINSFALILAPKIANMIFPMILAPAFIAELSFCLWLLFKGVDVAKWNVNSNG